MATQRIQHKRVTWTSIVKATPDDIEALREQYPHFHPLDLEDLLSRLERPKLDEYDEYLFTVMHFPLWDPVQRISRASEVDIFLGTTYIVTVHDGTLKPLVQLFERCQKDELAREKYMGTSASRLFHTIIDQLVDYLFPILYKVDANIRDIEEDIFDRDARPIIRDIAVLRRDNIALRRIVRPQLEILAALDRVDKRYLRGGGDDLEVYFDDIRDHLNKAVDTISDHTEVIANLADTANTITNQRTNEIVQILTIISVIMLPLTLISGIYGMNITLPLDDHPLSFFFVVCIMLGTGGAMLAYFRWRGWI
ncbi:MAG: magnesium transporter CorA family protein [Anaerolineae bacterium]|nr:magnesium transporter CorA family protein [Anaerolineae bacterium]